MSNATAKIRINLNLREFEIEGTEDFINSHSEKIESFLELLRSTPPSQPQPIIQQPVIVTSSASLPQQEANQTQKGSNEQVPEHFGEYFHLMPKDSKDVDKVLIAGNFAQIHNPEGFFTTNEVSSLLLEQGIKLSNTSRSVAVNIDSKRVIKLGKGKYKVSRDGLDYLRDVLATGKGE